MAKADKPRLFVGGSADGHRIFCVGLKSVSVWKGDCYRRIDGPGDTEFYVLDEWTDEQAMQALIDNYPLKDEANNG